MACLVHSEISLFPFRLVTVPFNEVSILPCAAFLVHKNEWASQLDQIFSLDGDWEDFSPSERALFNVAQKLGNAPVVLDGHDVKRAVELAGPRDLVQTVSFVTSMASINRISEATALPSEN